MPGSAPATPHLPTCVGAAAVQARSAAERPAGGPEQLPRRRRLQANLASPLFPLREDRQPSGAPTAAPDPPTRQRSLQAPSKLPTSPRMPGAKPHPAPRGTPHSARAPGPRRSRLAAWQRSPPAPRVPTARARRATHRQTPGRSKSGAQDPLPAPSQAHRRVPQARRRGQRKPDRADGS